MSDSWRWLYIPYFVRVKCARAGLFVRMVRVCMCAPARFLGRMGWCYDDIFQHWNLRTAAALDCIYRIPYLYEMVSLGRSKGILRLSGSPVFIGHLPGTFMLKFCLKRDGKRNTTSVRVSGWLAWELFERHSLASFFPTNLCFGRRRKRTMMNGKVCIECETFLLANGARAFLFL